MSDYMKAVINGDRIECGKCGALLSMVKSIPVLADPSIKERPPFITGSVHLETKCKHKDKGVYCNEVNEILL